MHIFDFRGKKQTEKLEVFPAEILDDPWVIYHGTRSHNETSIEKEGLRRIWQDTHLQQMRRIVSLYEAIEWAGESGGFPMLKSWAAGSDFQSGSTKPLFFALNPSLACRYAANVGGETSFAIWESLHDLHRLLSDMQLRSMWREARWRKEIRQLQGAPLPDWANTVNPTASSATDVPRLRRHWKETYQLRLPEPWDEDWEWLQHEVGELSDFFRHEVGGMTDYASGVVYAVNFRGHDLEPFEYRDTMGLVYHGDVAAEQLVAKAQIPKGDYGVVHFPSSKNTTKEGVVAYLMSRSPEELAEMESLLEFRTLLTKLDS